MELRIFEACLALVLLICLVPSHALGQRNKKPKLNATDKKFIVSKVLDEGFARLMDHSRFADCTIPIINDEKIIIIETNQPYIFPKRHSDFRFRLMSESQIEAEIKSNNGDCYLKLSDFRDVRMNKFLVTLWRWIEVITVVDGKSWYPARWVGATGLQYSVVKDKLGRWTVTFDKELTIVS